MKMTPSLRAGALMPAVLLPLTAPLALIFGALVALRMLLYRLGWLRTHTAAAPVISVGNLTLGGSGKTPVVEYLARLATARNLRPVVLSRGYRRRTRSHLMRVQISAGAPADAEAMGDEPYMLAQRNPELPIYVGRDRAEAARLAHHLDRPSLLLLDDGFQHLRLRRALDLLLVDAERGLGNERLAPWGILREPLAALHRADAVIIAKANLGDGSRVRRRLAALGCRAPVFTCEYHPRAVERLDGNGSLAPEALAGQTVSLLCAIAQPAGFARAVQHLGAEVAETLAYRDHHAYRAKDLAALEARLAGADPRRPSWLTTEKDAVKLRGRLRGADRLWVLTMDVRPDPAAEAFFIEFMDKIKLQ